MKRAALLTIPFLALLSSCYTPPAPGYGGAPYPAQAPGDPVSTPVVSPMDAYRGAQQAAGAINTARTIQSVF